jgi:hypothetical protein
VVEPTQAAVTMAIGRVRLGGTAKTFGTTQRAPAGNA